MIFFRADGNLEIGMGHLIRCLSLAKMLDPNFKISFCSLSAPPSFIEELKFNGFHFHQIAGNNDLIDLISLNDIVVLDHYDLGKDYHQIIRKKGVKLVCIDDIHDKSFDADLIINHSPSVKKSDYQAKPYTKYLLGVDFALLRPAFLNGVPKNRNIKAIENVFICFGGADSHNYTLALVNACIKNPTFKRIDIVTGVSYQYLNSIETINNEKVKHYHALNEISIYKVMANSDLAIVPSSGILFEALAAKCLVMSGYYVDNQKVIYDGFKNLNAFIDLGNFKNLDIVHHINFHHFANINKNIIDGKSGTRLLAEFNKL
jgi:UDP-2,4-diacetamido-2,4,6-trideoxy-beta-L-altropyranose hydrolase